MRRLTLHGEAVALLMMQGHRIAYELGLKDVTPYANIESMMTQHQWDEMAAALEAAGGRIIIVPRLNLLTAAARTGSRNTATSPTSKTGA